MMLMIIMAVVTWLKPPAAMVVVVVVVVILNQNGSVDYGDFHCIISFPLIARQCAHHTQSLWKQR